MIGMFSLKDIYFVISGIISEFTDKGQFQYLTNLKGPQEGTYLYTTQFLSLRQRSIFYQKIPYPFMEPLYCPLKGSHNHLIKISLDLSSMTPGENHNEWYQYYCSIFYAFNLKHIKTNKQNTKTGELCV